MKLIRFSAVGLHDALDISLDFKQDLNLIVGINGSGKTSALNAIEWLLKPSFPKLAVSRFSKLTLDIEFQGQRYCIEAKKDKILSLTVYDEARQALFDPITVNLYHDVQHLPEDDPERIYFGLTPENHERKCWEFMAALPDPVAITLDRTIAAETSEAAYFDPVRREQRRPPKKDALEEVRRLAAEHHVAYQRLALEHDNELKAKIIMTALQEPDIGRDGIQVPTLRATRGLQKKVSTYLKTSIKSVDVEAEVRKFFQYIIALTETHSVKSGSDELFTRLVVSQYARIDRLAQAFNEFETRNAAAFHHLKTYLDSLNRFLKDTGKQIDFEPGSSRLVFRFTAGDSKTKEKARSVSNLSSGEKQILILLTFLAFSPSGHGVFIIDEPELSLHPKWQNDFIDAVLALKSSEMQLLIATHSPEIVGRRRDAVVALRSRSMD